MINFPKNPANGQKYTFGNKTWTYNGRAWLIQAVTDTYLAAAQAAQAAAQVSAGTALKTLATESVNPPANPIDGQEWTDAATGHRYTWNANSSCWAETYAALSVDNPVLVDALKTSMLSAAGTTLMNFIASGVGAVLRSLLSKLRETVSAQDYGAVGDGVANDRPAIQAALDTGKNVLLPNGVYHNVDGIPLYMRTVGQQLIGESKQNTYLTSAAGSTHDLLRVAAALADVSGIMFRPGSAGNICARIYAGWCHLHDNRFLSAGANSGTAVVLTDQNPETGATVAGAYTHRIVGNHFGAAGGYTFARDIDDYSANGITATKFVENQHLCDNPIRLVRGGGNSYRDNLFQSATGTAGVKAGNCIDLGANVTSETIHGNYFELYAYAVVARNISNTYQVFRATQNHYDNVANTYLAQNSNFYQDDGVSLTELKNGWSDNYSSATKRIFNGPTGTATTILELDDANKAIKVNKLYSSIPNLSYTADNQTQVPASRVAIITGGGATRAGCILGTTGVQDGQELTLLGITWSVTLTNTNIRFANNTASAIFGNVAGQVQAMTLVYRAATSTWYEVSRTVY